MNSIISSTLTAALAATLAACTPTSSNGISTPSTIYNAKYAADKKLNQKEVDICIAEGKKAQQDDSGEFRNVKAGKAYEACVDRIAKSK